MLFLFSRNQQTKYPDRKKTALKKSRTTFLFRTHSVRISPERFSFLLPCSWWQMFTISLAAGLQTTAISAFALLMIQASTHR